MQARHDASVLNQRLTESRLAHAEVAHAAQLALDDNAWGILGAADSGSQGGSLLSQGSGDLSKPGTIARAQLEKVRRIAAEAMAAAAAAGAERRTSEGLVSHVSGGSLGGALAGLAGSRRQSVEGTAAAAAAAAGAGVVPTANGGPPLH
jgi:hypothetical protein